MDVYQPQALSAQQKYIFILLSVYPDRTSRFLRKINRWKFSHASIGLLDASGKFYSLNGRGFRIEDPKKYPTAKKKEVPCALYRVPVEPAVFERIRKVLDAHVENSPKYVYSFWGVVLCLLHIKRKTENRYFCSQFVAEVLETAKALPLAKHSSLYVPDDFSRLRETRLIFQGTLRKLAYTRLLVAPI